MLIDHTGLIIYNNEYILRAIGRIAFPLFSFLIIYNYIFNTKNKKNYLKRLISFLIISELLFIVFEQNIINNIFYTLILGLSFIFIFEQQKEDEYNSISQNLITITIFLFFLFLSLFTDYEIYGFILIVSIYLYYKFKNTIFFILGIITLLLLSTIETIGFNLISLLLIYIAYNFNVKHNIPRTNKYFFYLFYPFHIILLIYISNLL
jgi:hypothetical protein